MRRNLVFGLGVSISVFLAGLASSSSALAQAKPTLPAAVPAAAKTGLRPELGAELHAAHKLLAEADHDYKGHRAKAAEEVHKALKELGFHHQHVSPAAPGAAAGGTVVAKKAAHGSPHEAQAVSDGQLRQAQQILQGALTQLGANHPHAAANVKAAISEINTALSIK